MDFVMFTWRTVWIKQIPNTYLLTKKNLLEQTTTCFHISLRKCTYLFMYFQIWRNFFLKIYLLLNLLGWCWLLKLYRFQLYDFIVHLYIVLCVYLRLQHKTHGFLVLLSGLFYLACMIIKLHFTLVTTLFRFELPGQASRLLLIHIQKYKMPTSVYILHYTLYYNALFLIFYLYT